MNICFAQHVANKHKHLEKNRRMVSVCVLPYLPIVPLLHIDAVSLSVPFLQNENVSDGSGKEIRSPKWTDFGPFFPCPDVQTHTKWYSQGSLQVTE